MKTVWILAGEASGDIYGSLLIDSLRKKDDKMIIKAMGGPAIKKTGVELMIDSSELGVMGFIEVLKLYRTFKRLLNELYKKLEEEKPDAIILIDYPGFNLRIAEKAKELGIKVFYFISPQIWAWKKKRKWKIAKLVDKMFCIFPFESQHYDGTGLDVEFVGHPLLSIINKEKDNTIIRDDKKILLLPGSRNNEIDRLLPAMLDTAIELKKENKDYKFHIPVPRENLINVIKNKISNHSKEAEELNIEFSIGDTRLQMQTATAGIAASGTVTVEATMLNLPLVVIYKVSFISYLIFKTFIKEINFISITNIMFDKCIYQEFLQYDVTKENILPALKNILPNGSRRQEVEEGMKEVTKTLGLHQDIPAYIADKIIE